MTLLAFHSAGAQIPGVRVLQQGGDAIVHAEAYMQAGGVFAAVHIGRVRRVPVVEDDDSEDVEDTNADEDEDGDATPTRKPYRIIGGDADEGFAEKMQLNVYPQVWMAGFACRRLDVL